MELRSGAFAHGGEIPREHGYKSGNRSPPLEISGVPPGAKSLALVMDDPDAVGAVGKVWTHWVVWDIDPSAAGIGGGQPPPGCLEGATDFGGTGYGGPAPPDREHTYVFKLYALDRKLGLAAGSTKRELEEAMSGRVVAEARLEGRCAP